MACARILILPGTVFVSEVFIEALSADTKHSAIKCDFSGNPAVLCFQSQKHHSLVFADFRRLAAKKAAGFFQKFVFLLQTSVSLSCSLTRLRSMVISSERLIALAGVWEPSPISSLPFLTAFNHVWMVPSGIPNSFAAFSATDFFGKFYCLYFVFLVIFTCHFEYLLVLLILL